MGKKLAIRGHSTRGKEVIKILEMIGGKISNECTYENGFDIDYFFFICEEEKNLIDGISYKDNELLSNYICFTLEEFLAKFPYKVGDKVHIYVQNDDIDGRYDIDVTEITAMRWNPARCKIAYKMKNINREFYKEEIKCKAEEIMEEKDKAKAPNLKGEDYSGKRYGYKIPDGYEFDTISNGKIILKPIKPKYPITYEECCQYLGCDDKIKMELIGQFIRLINARNAYWKIAGEQMGLDEPWKANFTQGSGIKYIILFANGKVIWNRPECEGVTGSRVLAFPTAEMRDAFYKNFEDLIEGCKELL